MSFFFLRTFVCVRLFRRIVLQPLLPRFFFSAFFLHQKRKKKNKIGTHPFIQNNGKQTMSDNEGGADVDFNDDLFTCANVRLYIYIFIYIYTYVVYISLLSLSFLSLQFCYVFPFDIFLVLKNTFKQRTPPLTACYSYSID